MNAVLQPNQQTTNQETPEQAARRFAGKIIREGYKPEALHTYTDADGSPMFWRIRCKHADGQKWIRPMRWNGRAFEIGEPEFPSGKPLYRLHELHSRTAETVAIVEGEKCVDALEKIGVLSTTSGGADSAEKADWTALRGRDVLLWPDNDEAGQKYADIVARLLTDMGCAVRRVDVTALGLNAKGDAVDWLGAHPAATKADVLALPCASVDACDVTSAISAEQRQKTPRGGSHYQITKDGVFFCEQHPERGELPPLWICSPLFVCAETRNENGHSWGRLLEWQDNDGRPHRWALPMEMLKGDCTDLRGRLLAEGLQIAPSQKSRNLLAAYIQTQTPEREARVLCVERTGWHDQRFVLPNRVFGDDAESIVYQTEADHDCGLSVAGTLAEWREHVSKVCAGNTRHVFAICCAFAPPLMQWTGLESGGFHLRGSSSGGKSTAQRLAASVWGHPERYKKSWRTTDNALEGVAAAHNDLLLLLDEIKQVEEKRAGEIAYMLGNGEGKGRATREGGNRKRARWRLLFLSSGELSLADMMRDAGKRTYAGQEVRMADIPADAGKGLGSFDVLNGFASAKELADTLNANAARFHGTAGVHLLEVLAQSPQSIGEDAKRMIGEFLSECLPKDASAQAGRVCSRFALVAVAGELATQAGITGWEIGEAESACKACFTAWLEAFGTSDRESAAVFTQVRAIIEAHGESRFQTIGGDDSRPVIHRLGFKESSKAGSWIYYVLPEAMRAEVCAGLSLPHACKVLAKAGWLETDSQGKSSVTRTMPGMGKQRVYVLHAERMGE